MTALLFAAIALTFLFLLLGYLVLGPVRKAAAALAPLVPASSKPRARATKPVASKRMSAAQLEQSRWTALDDQQFARFVRDSSH